MELSRFILDHLKKELIGKKVKFCVSEKEFEQRWDRNYFSKQEREAIHSRHKNEYKYKFCYQYNIIALTVATHKIYEIGVIEEVVMNIKAQFVYANVKTNDGELKYLPLKFECRMDEISPGIYMLSNPSKDVLLNHIR